MTSRRLQLFLPLILIVLVASRDSGADVVTIGANHDNTLYEDATGSLSNGAGPTMFAGRTGPTGTGTRRALISFDVAAAVPSGATITAAQLRLNMSQTVTGPQSIALCRMNLSWGEGASNAGPTGGQGDGAQANDATWTNRFHPGSPWPTAGATGSFAAASATRSVSGLGAYTWGSNAAIVADVQGWLNTPSSNNGWILIGNEITDGTAKRFDTHENSIVANRPSLTITYTPPAVATEPTSWSRIKALLP